MLIIYFFNKETSKTFLEEVLEDQDWEDVSEQYMNGFMLSISLFYF